MRLCTIPASVWQVVSARMEPPSPATLDHPETPKRFALDQRGHGNVQDWSARVRNPVQMALSSWLSALGSRLVRPARNRSAAQAVVACVCVLFIVWSAGFIRTSSVRLADGGRAYCLFDDAMISVRYAENLVRGRGLVWNAGETVEGYSNPLMVAVMAACVAFLPKSEAVLAIQSLGVLTMLGIALLGARLYERIAMPERRGPAWLPVGLILSVYVLSFWSLLGMETGLVALLTAMCARTALSNSDLSRTALRLGALTAMLYLCRPDAVLIGAIFGASLLWRAKPPGPGAAGASPSRKLPDQPLRDSRNLWTGVAALALFALPVVAVVASHTAFRLAYYGEWLPNTAVLKLTGVPWRIRLHDGATFVGPFLEGLIPLLGLAAYGMAHSPSRSKATLAAPMAALVAYQVSVGGEPWAYWRIMAPAMPLLVVLACDGAMLLAGGRNSSRAGGHPLGIGESARAALLASALLVWAMAMHNRPFLKEALLLARFQEATLNAERVRTGLALRDLTRPSATVAVVGAGAIPFYADRRGVDMLGKCDPYIARLKPDLTGGVSWYGMVTMPGHNKYDLQHSVVETLPTCVETPRWGRDDLSDFVKANYVAVQHRGGRLWLLRGSPDVLWERMSSHPVERDSAKPVSASVEADLDGDGRIENVRLDPSAAECLTISRTGNPVAVGVPTRWLPWKLVVADADGDGRLDIAVGVHKGTRYIPQPHNCLFIYSFDGRDLVPLWLGSALSRPFTDFAFAPSGQGDASTLFAVEETVQRQRTVSEYRWNGFGFTLATRHGPWRAVRIVRVTPDGLELDADGARMTIGCLPR